MNKFRNNNGEIVRGGILAVTFEALFNKNGLNTSVIKNLANLKKSWDWKVILLSPFTEKFITESGSFIDVCTQAGLAFDAINTNLVELNDRNRDPNYIYADVYLGESAINVEDFQQRIII